MAWVGVFLIGVMSGAALGLATGVPVAESYAATPVAENRLRSSASTIMGRPADAIIPVVPDGLMPQRPRIAIVIDDLGLSWAGFRAVNTLPAPVTLSFLPYGDDAQAMMNELSEGHDAMLHLPMEPQVRVQDAGPNMLVLGQSEEVLRKALLENLTSLSGYSGVNNHTGSKFTADRDAMAVVLKELDQRGLFFLDSITTGRPVAHRLAAQHDYAVIERNVFLDHDYENISVESVKAQLAELERIAVADGYAIGIGHPYKVTTEVLSEWMRTAELRGFEIVLVRELTKPEAPRALAQLR
ncbi:MAG: divergent polysaccharide deacetylase family protein [Pseudomonadota bacterium]